ncbi:MAG: helix-turn-helix domain-containing protein [Planctomycetes bacterium]|nr:helix-turn-helix domain-containing protein [Planctomycetota bacterium]
MNNTSAEIVQLEPICIRPKVAAALIGVSPRKFAEMKASGLLPPACKLGGCCVYKTSDLFLWAEFDFPCLDRFLALKEATKNESKR